MSKCIWNAFIARFYERSEQNSFYVPKKDETAPHARKQRNQEMGFGHDTTQVNGWNRDPWIVVKLILEKRTDRDKTISQQDTQQRNFQWISTVVQEEARSTDSQAYWKAIEKILISDFLGY
ncbi:hypothetical protein M436DRAFT_65784 [Aureobasidium namibiae CBS 147.97]|uniref:Uncharacterized protein n=1 Tax=Aureobasidium namibiae CBS 147.97 TaxID=1043004 RepID=A0A074WCX1_9PEZI